MDSWFNFEDGGPENARLVWLGNHTTVNPEPVVSYSHDYTIQMKQTRWTHWSPCIRPQVPRRTAREIALTALQTSREAGWTDSQLITALIAETDPS